MECITKALFTGQHGFDINFTAGRDCFLQHGNYFLIQASFMPGGARLKRAVQGGGQSFKRNGGHGATNLVAFRLSVKLLRKWKWLYNLEISSSRWKIISLGKSA